MKSLIPDDLSSVSLMLDYVEKIGACSPEQLITVWTVQHSAALEALRQKGQLIGDPKYAFRDDRDAPWRRAAYSWMNDQMQTRGFDIENDQVPLWAFLTPHPSSGSLWTCYEGDQCVHMEIPKSRLLISFHQPWDRLLKLSGNPSKEFLIANEDDELMHKGRNSQKPNDMTCRKSWEKMFDLSLARSKGFRWEPIVLQATASMFFSSDIREMT